MKLTKLPFLYYFISLLLSVPSIFGQSQMRLIGGQNKQKMPFELINNLIIIPLELNGSNLNFILDSGTSKTIIFGIKNSDSIPFNNSKKIKLRGLGSGKPIEGNLSKNNTIEIQNIVGVNQTVYVILDDKFDLSDRMGKTIHGIIGYDLLKNF